MFVIRNETSEPETSVPLIQVGLLFVALFFFGFGCTNTERSAESPRGSNAAQGKDLTYSAQVIETRCSSCHPFPKAEDFTMATWSIALDYKYHLFEKFYPQSSGFPSRDQVEAYYAARAPRKVPSVEAYPPAPDALRPRFRSVDGVVEPVIVSHTLYVNEPSPALVVADLLGPVREYPIQGGEPRILFMARYPAALAIADLDGDGLRDFVVGELGSFKADDSDQGRLVWNRALRNGGFQRIDMGRMLARTADVAVGDLDGDGDQDVVVADFGWQNSGRLEILENRGGGVGSKLAMKPHLLDGAHGAVSVAIADVDADGDQDIVALFAQGREELILYENSGNFAFHTRILFKAPTPMWGSLGVRIVDLDGDGDKDILHYNGDNLDAPKIARFQGVHLLENHGGGRFANRQLAVLPGMGDVQPADVDRDGDLDLIAAASLPPGVEETAVDPSLGQPLPRTQSILLLEQTRGLNFNVYGLSDHGACYVSAALATYPQGDSVFLGRFGLGWSLFNEQTAGVAVEQNPRCRGSHEVLALDFGPRKVSLGGALSTSPVVSPVSPESQVAQLESLAYTYSRLVEAEPGFAGHHDKLGVVLHFLGRNEQAIVALQKAIALDGKRSRTHSNLANVYGEMGRADKAVETARKAIELNPTSALGHNTLAVSLVQRAMSSPMQSGSSTGQSFLSEALRTAKQAVDLEPLEVTYVVNYARCLAIAGRLRDGVKQLERAASLAPGSPEIGQMLTGMRNALRRQEDASRNASP